MVAAAICRPPTRQPCAGWRLTVASWRPCSAASRVTPNGSSQTCGAGGRAKRRARRPRRLLTLREDLSIVGRALDVFAAELDRLAAALAEAEEEHGWSWRKVALVSAVVVVTAGAVVVSVGSAGAATPGAAAAESAVVSAAAGQMAAASVAAASAEAAAVEGLLVAARLARTVEALRAIVVPRLMVASMTAAKWVETPLGGATVGGATSRRSTCSRTGRSTRRPSCWGALLGATESIVLSPGRSRGYVELTPSRLALMEQPARRRQLLAIARARSPQDVRPFSVHAKQGEDSPQARKRVRRLVELQQGIGSRLEPGDARLRRRAVDGAHQRHLEEAACHHVHRLRQQSCGRLRTQRKVLEHLRVGATTTLASLARRHIGGPMTASDRWAQRKISLTRQYVAKEISSFDYGGDFMAAHNAGAREDEVVDDALDALLGDLLYAVCNHNESTPIRPRRTRSTTSSCVSGSRSIWPIGMTGHTRRSGGIAEAT